MEVKIDASALEKLAERLEQAPRVLSDAKRRAFVTAAPKLKEAVDREIGGAGKVRSWQTYFVGSKGGYAAARPRAKTFAEDYRGRKTRYTVGAVTNAINSGHRYPSSKMGYRSRAGNVPGLQFYQRAQVQAEQVAQEAGEQIIQALTDHLEG